MASVLSSLGTTPAVFSALVEEKVSRFRRKLVPHEFGYLEWTIDGVPLREAVAWPRGQVAREVTPVGNGYALREYEADYLRAIVGAPATRDWTVMPDGRVPLLVCRVDFDLDCATLTAELIRSDHHVEWRDIAWQCGYEPLDLSAQQMPVRTMTFHRKQYDDVVLPLLAAVPEN